MLVLEGVVGLYGTIQLQFLQHYFSGYRLGLLWYWMICLGNKQKPFCHIWDCIQVLHFGLLFDYHGYPISSKGFLSTIHPLQSILVCWFLECRCLLLLLFESFQFSLIHRPNIPDSYAILLFTASDFTSITSHIHKFCFGSISSFFLELFLHWYPVA